MFGRGIYFTTNYCVLIISSLNDTHAFSSSTSIHPSSKAVEKMRGRGGKILEMLGGTQFFEHPIWLQGCDDDDDCLTGQICSQDFCWFNCPPPKTCREGCRWVNLLTRAPGDRSANCYIETDGPKSEAVLLVYIKRILVVTWALLL